MTTQVTGDLYVKLDGKLVEIKRQMRQLGGYPFDPEKLDRFLQRAVEGRFDDNSYFKLTLTKAFNPVEFLGKGWSVWRGPADGSGLEGGEDRDVREDELDVVDFGQLILETNLQGEETSITGEEKLRRLKAGKDIRLSGKGFLALWEDYQTRKAEAKPEESILEKLRKARKVTRIYFFGLVLRSPYGYRNVPYLYLNDREWFWGCSWLDCAWLAAFLSASLASVG